MKPGQQRPAGKKPAPPPDDEDAGLPDLENPIKVEQPPPLPQVEKMSIPIAQLSIHDILKYGRSLKVSDIHIAPGAPIMFRLARQLVPVTKESLTSKQSERLSLELLSDHQQEQFRKDLDFDFMSIDEYGRYRVNVGYFDGDVGTVIRVLVAERRARRWPSSSCRDVVRRAGSGHQGAGAADRQRQPGQDDDDDRHHRRDQLASTPGTSSRSRIRSRYLHTNKRGLVRQRQTGRDTQTFAPACGRPCGRIPT